MIERETFDFRIVCSDSRSGSSTAPQAPQGVADSDSQGAQSGSSQIERAWLTTVVAPRKGGASRSKWTRKTRPWNASLPTAVVASHNAGPCNIGSSEFLPNDPPYSLPRCHPNGARGERAMMSSAAQTLSGFTYRRRTQGYPREVPAPMVSERTAASTAPSSDVRLGGGDRETSSA